MAYSAAMTAPAHSPSHAALPAPPLQRRQLTGLGLAAAISAFGGLSACSAPNANDFARLWTSLRGVPVGAPDSTQKLIVFFDTRCGYCRQLWQQMLAVQQQTLVLWTPVAILAPGSRSEALALLASSEPLAWLQAHMAGRRPAAGSNAEGAELATREQALHSNLQAMEQLPGSARSVPQTAGLAGAQLQVVRGAAPLTHLQSRFGLHWSLPGG